jgi:two-component system, sensor histidine kinase and response regulator
MSTPTQSMPTQSILNVDDYGPSRYARTKVLRQAGFEVLEAATGKEALQIVIEHSPALVLLDVNLPDMSGFEICRQIRKNPKTATTTVVHISASSVQAHQQVHGLDSGADSYLVEPIDPGVLIATVKAFLRARMAEDALRRSNDELQWFAYRVAHDLNEPLRTVTAYVQLLELELAGHLDQNTLQSMHFVVEGAERMRSFIDELLRYARATQSDRVVATFDCEAMLTRVTSKLQAAIETTGTCISHDPLPVVNADAAFEYVFQNLISNAIKYRREGVTPEIHISARPDAGSWLFSVRDNGIGIEPRYQKSIFRIFHRLHSPEVPGYGIGLALSQKVIHAHQGNIWVESEPGAGSTFCFTLPQSSDASD